MTTRRRDDANGANGCWWSSSQGWCSFRFPSCQVWMLGTDATLVRATRGSLSAADTCDVGFVTRSEQRKECLMTDSSTPRTYPAGVSCWIDLEPDDVESVGAFYAELLGWTLTNAMPPQA